MWNNHETLNSVVQRLCQEVMNLKEKNGGSAAITVATFLGSDGTINYGIPGAQVGFMPCESVGSLEGYNVHWT